MGSTIAVDWYHWKLRVVMMPFLSSWLTPHIAIMMTSSYGNIFCVTGPLCGEFTCHQWIPCTKASNAEQWCFLWSVPWINSCVNNREAGDLRCQHAHHDITVMIMTKSGATSDENGIMITLFFSDTQPITTAEWSAKNIPYRLSYNNKYVMVTYNF